MSERRLLELLGISRDMIYKANLVEGRFEYVSPSSEALSGYAPETLCAMPLEDVVARVHPDDASRYWQGYELLSSAVVDGPDQACEYRWRCKDGQYRWFVDKRSTVRGADGTLVGIVGVVRDVTRRRVAQEALRRSEERYRLIVETAAEGIWITDADDRTTFVNLRMADMLGYTVEEMLGSRLAEYVDPETLQEIGRAASGGHGGARGRGDLRLRRRDGTELWALVSTTPVPDGEGGYGGLLAMVTDITGRKASDEALKESEARYRSLFENMGDALLLFDGDLQIVDYQDARGGLLGLDRHSLLRKTLKEALPGLEAPECVERALGDVLEGGDPEPLRGLRLGLSALDGAPSQEERYLDLLAYRVPVGGDQHAALLCRDVSRLRKLELELAAARNLESLGRLASGVAHDFGNLLAVIMSEAELLRTMLPAGGREVDELDQILNATEVGASLTRQLLAMSRGEEPEPEIVHLNRTVDDTLPLVRRMLPSTVQLELDLTEEPIYFWGDSGQLSRVLLNLVSNARDAMPDGGMLRIETRHAQLDPEACAGLGMEPGAYAVLVVSDTGVGIPQDDSHAIFEPLFSTKKHKGAGLGLWVVYWVLQQCQGKVSVTSLPGEGSSFTVYLPAPDIELFEEF